MDLRLMMLEYNMGLFGFGIFVGMIIALILMCIWGVFRKEDNTNDTKGTDKNTLERDRSVGVNDYNSSRGYWSNNHNDYRESEIGEVIEDLIICDMLGLL